MANGQQTDALMRSLPRGSAARGGRSLVAIGDLTGFVAVAPGTQLVVDYTIDEPGVLDRLIIQADQFGLTVNAINLDNDNLISGAVGANLFTDQQQSPYFGHRVTQNTKLRITLGNITANPIQVVHGFTVR
jgi:hypothetical protein